MTTWKLYIKLKLRPTILTTLLQLHCIVCHHYKKFLINLLWCVPSLSI